jgi:hypothetical protein
LKPATQTLQRGPPYPASQAQRAVFETTSQRPRPQSTPAPSHPCIDMGGVKGFAGSPGGKSETAPRASTCPSPSLSVSTGNEVDPSAQPDTRRVVFPAEASVTRPWIVSSVALDDRVISTERGTLRRPVAFSVASPVRGSIWTETCVASADAGICSLTTVCRPSAPVVAMTSVGELPMLGR